MSDLQIDVTFSAWTLIVFYENGSENLRQLTLFDGLYYVNPPMQGTLDQTSVQLTGFLVPPGFDAKVGVFGYEGDSEYDADFLSVNGNVVANAANPAVNFFNSSRTTIGAPAFGTWDVPKLSGAADTMGGYDLDTADVTSLVKAGDTQATVAVGSTYDKFFVGGFVTSVTTLAPSFDTLVKTVSDDNGGNVLTGDTLTYEISGSNSGDDTAEGVVINDKLDPGLEYVSGTLQILSGGGIGYKTDPSQDDEAEFDSNTRTLTWRLGAGADTSVGGMMAPGATFKVRYKAEVIAQQGTVSNSAEVNATGKSGSGKSTWTSDDPNKPGTQSTDVDVVQCETNAQCAGALPHCNANTHTCEGCVVDGECIDPAKPACQPNGQCGQCSLTNHQMCSGVYPQCDEAVGVCVFCVPGTDPAPACTGSSDGQACISLNGKTFCGCVTDQDCGSPECVGNSYNARECKYAGWCQTKTTGVDCTPYKCSAFGCGTSCTSDGDCADQHYCEGSSCVLKKSGAGPCAETSECLSGYCVDGVCCDKQCAGQCEACDLAGKEGVCSAVSGEPHGIRPSCAGTGACEGSCDGTGSGACTYPGATVSCGTVCSAAKVTISACDGAGKCQPASTKDCAPFACDGTLKCKTSCALPGDCSEGYYCDQSGACTAQVDAGPGNDGAAGSSGSAGAGGSTGTGGSAAAAGSQQDDAGGPPEVKTEPDEGGGCGCSIPHRGNTGAGFALGLLALAWAARRRRR